MTSSALLSSLILLLQLGEQLTLLFTQARPTPLPLSKPLGVSSPIILIARSTSGTAQARRSGPFTSWHMKMLLVPRLLLDAIQLLRLTLFDPRVAAACLDAWRTSFARPSSQGRHFLPLKGGIKNLLQPSYAKEGAGFHLLASRSPCVPGRLEPFSTMLPLGSSDSAFSLQSAPIVRVAIARWKHIDTFLPTAAGLPTFP